MHKLFLAAMLLTLSSLSAQCPNLIWSDEFNGSSLNEEDWNIQIGDGCDLGICDWGNSEQQWYARENLVVENGILKINARRENIGGKSYTSGRITTKGKQDFRYGYYEARIKVPAGGGLWPAFWMLSTDEVYGGWPASGEIDIMEWIGNEPEVLFGTLHYGQDFPNNSSTGDQLLLTDKAWSDDYHIYAIDWQEDYISWFVDGHRYGIKRPGNLSPERWPFDQDFHFLLNLALGGTFGGALSSTAIPATMEIDYLRVYDLPPPSLRGPVEVETDATNAAYVVDGLPDGASIEWGLPDGAVITDDSSPNGIIVDFGETGGRVTATITGGCEDRVLGIEVYVPPTFALTKEFSFENFDQEAQAVFEFSTGSLTEVNNPAANSVNNSALVGKYDRDGGSEFDVIVYDVSSIGDVAGYVEGTRAFSLDVYTDALPGQEIILQLETPAALPENYPTGRHSRYRAQTAKQGEWHRLSFTLLDEPDGGASDRGVRKMVILFNPGRFNNNTYYYDNLDGYSDNPNGLTGAGQLNIPLSLSPNPVSEVAFLDFSLQERSTVYVRLLDGRGKEIMELPAFGGLTGDNRLLLPVSELPSGVYFVQLRIANKSQLIRMIKP